ncbi:MAG: 50S ribosomal protein L3 [Deltaproteobacteria bacterium]|nr:50S ribosomal protein L3 [Deltaproteobacteria bacterium]
MNRNFGLLGKKIGMTQVFNPDGSRIPVTAVELGPCVVVQKRTMEKDGYVAIQLGFQDKKESRVNKPELGHFKKASVSPKQFLREFRVSEEESAKYEVGQEVKIDLFKNNQKVDVKGTSKGKGFAGVFKSYGFHGGKASHGVHEVYRHGGSLGMCMTPGRVLKGKKMAGHHSNKTVTIQTLEIVRIFPDENLAFIKGSIPGSRNSLFKISPAHKAKS